MRPGPSAVSRREFLRLSALAGMAVAGPGLVDQVRAAATGRLPLHVVIVGAGLAGLTAAFELERAGHRVTILEADPRHIGGRARTLRFEDGLHGEAGAMRIPAKHELTRRYVKQFNLTMRPFVMGNPEAYYYVRGARVRARDVKQLNPLFKLTDAERNKSPDDLWAAVMTRRAKALTDAERADLLSPELKTDALHKLDQLSLQQLCEGDGLSQEAIELLMVTYGQETLIHSAATEHLREERLELWTLPFDEIVGGTDLLPAAFAAALKSKVRSGCEVIRLENSADGRHAAAIYTESGQTQRIEGDFVLCTLPLPVLQRTDAPLSPEKWRAVRQLNYDSSTKVLAICNQRFWEAEDGIFGGGTFSDLLPGTTYYPSDNAQAKDAKISAGAGVTLASYSWGQNARRLGGLPEKERGEIVLRHLAKIHPQVAREGVVRRTASWAWDSFKWSGGAFAWFNPGQHTHLYRYLLMPEGRIHFAGEHASLAHTWMQGAIESALRATAEILGQP